MRKVIYLLFLLPFVGCVESKKREPHEKITPLEIKRFDNQLDLQKMEQIYPLKDLKVYSTTDTENSQIKTLTSFDNFQTFLIDDKDSDFYFVEIAILGNDPKNIKGYVLKEFLQEKKESYFDAFSFENTGGENFRSAGNIKPISESEYSQLKKRTDFLVNKTSEGIETNENGNYEFKTNNGQIVEVDNEATIVGFCSLLQSYVFKKDENFWFYSKLNHSKKPIIFKSLPTYNEAKDLLVEVSNEGTGTTKITLYKITSELAPESFQSFAFNGFLTAENSVFWVSDYALIAKIISPKTINPENSTYIRIQFLPSTLDVQSLE